MIETTETTTTRKRSRKKRRKANAKGRPVAPPVIFKEGDSVRLRETGETSTVWAINVDPPAVTVILTSEVRHSRAWPQRELEAAA